VGTAPVPVYSSGMYTVDKVKVDIY